MKRANWTRFVLLIALAANAAACSAPPTPVSSTPVVSSAKSFSDPFAYCAAVGTIDAPDARYTGAKVPDSIAKALQKATGAAPDAPLTIFVQNSYWRCMDGKVYGCFGGANLPCTAKADTNRTPTAEEKDFCKANPNADVVPAVVAGRETVYEWQCKNGAPEIVKQLATPDARGFLSQFWYQLAPS